MLGLREATKLRPEWLRKCTKHYVGYDHYPTRAMSAKRRSKSGREEIVPHLIMSTKAPLSPGLLICSSGGLAEAFGGG